MPGFLHGFPWGNRAGRKKHGGRGFRARPSRGKVAAGAALLALAGLAVFLMRPPALAHSGHNKKEVGAYDLDAPRTVSPQTAKHIGLQTREVGLRPVEDVLRISGVVKPLPDRDRRVVSRMPGRIVAITKRVGDAVKKGEVLVEVDSPQFARNLYEVRKLEVEYQKLQLEIGKFKAAAERQATEVETAKAQAAYAKAEFERAQGLSREGAVSQRVLAERRTAWVRAKGGLRLKEISRSLSKTMGAGLAKQAKALALSRRALLVMNNIEPSAELGAQPSAALKIKARADGIVVARSARLGDWVEPGRAILEVADLREVQIEGELPESLIARVRARQSNKVRIRTPSDPRYLSEGTIRYLAPMLDPVTRTAHLIIDAPNAKGVLRGEMWVDLAIVLRARKKAPVVPRSAVVVYGPMHFVFVKKGKQYQKQDIVPGVEDDRFVEVKDGVFPGDVVVVQGAYSLTQLRPKGKKYKK